MSVHCARPLAFAWLALVSALLLAGTARAQDAVLLHSRVFVPTPGLSAAEQGTILAQPPLSLARVHVLLQTNGFPNDAQAAALAALGIERLLFVPNRGWLASVPRSSGSLAAIAANSSVRAIDPLLASDRLAPGLIADGIDARLIGTDGKAFLQIRIYPDVPLQTAISVLSQYLASIESQDDPSHTLIARIDPAQLANLAGQDPVVLIEEPPPPAEEDNDQVRINTNVSNVGVVEDTVAAGAVTGIVPGSPYAYGGEGVLLGQWEGRRADTCHPDFVGSLLLDGSIAGTQIRVWNGINGDGSLDNDCADVGYNPALDTRLADHPTHVAGTVLGNGSQSVAAGGVSGQWRGMAPNAEIVAYRTPAIDTDGDGAADALPPFASQYLDATGQGVAISTNSWGTSHCHQINCAALVGCNPPASSCYDSGAQLYDQLIVDVANADQSAAISILGSAGNQGTQSAPGMNSFGTTRVPNSAKNSIVVGSIESDTNALVATSSRGPVDDGRIKPDVLAPGSQAGGALVTSTVMTIFTDDAGLPGAQGAASCSDGAAGNTADDCVFPYDRISGTSMATPAAAGVAALLVQQRRAATGANPWPSTVKALLIHTAIDQCCFDRNLGANAIDSPGPNYAYGYGRIDAQAALDLARDARNGRVLEDTGFAGSGGCPTDPAQVCDYNGDAVPDDDVRTVNVPAGVPSMRVTLVYDDLPGSPVLAAGAPVLRNDLDLFLRAPDGSVTRPWILNPAAPLAAAVRGRDALNPVEVVDIANPMPGIWQLVVRPVSVQPSTFGNEPAQRYSLVYRHFESDLMIRDYTDDDGGVPSVRVEPVCHDGAGNVIRCWTPIRFWTDSDIHAVGGEIVEPGIAKTFRVIVKNRGTTAANNALVNLYWADAGVGLDYADFTANPIGSCMLTLAPGEESAPSDCSLDHTWAPGELIVGDDGKAHPCLLATVTHANDPITFPGFATVPGGANPQSYVPWDNNLAQQNVGLELTVPGEDGEFDVGVNNPSPVQGTGIRVVLDPSALPAGWSVQLIGGPIITLPPGGSQQVKVKLAAAPAATNGTRGTVHVFGEDLQTGELIGGVSVALQIADGDGDGHRDWLDNCRYVPNPLQTDTGRVGPGGADGIGNACQCADADDDGDGDGGDVATQRAALADPIGAPLSAAGLAKCSAIGGASDCDVRDVVVLRRALAPSPLGPGVAQVCAAAVP